MDVREVLPPDAIPSIDDPRFGEDYIGEGDDLALVIEASPPHAYPFRILHFHEIVNDVVEGDPVAVTWCPLCGSAMVYDRHVEGRTLTFGVSGKLADDDLIMYDRETGSEWKQSLGRCIAGEFEGVELTLRPAPVMSIERFRGEHPDGVVLQPERTKSEAASETDDPAPIDYADDPYERYLEAEGFGLAAHREEDQRRTWSRDDLAAKTVVLGIERDGEAVGFPYPWVVDDGGVVNATVGGTDIVVFTAEGELHAFEDPGYRFMDTPDGIEADGTTWDPVTGEAADGRQLERIPSKRLFAFNWQDDHGPDAFYERPSG